MNVLFVSHTRLVDTPYKDESTRYRCYHMAEGLRAAGYLADVCTLDALSLVNLSRYDIISIHQPQASRKLLTVLERANKLNIKTVADLDCLEFDPLLAAESPKARLNTGSVATVRAAFMRQSLALKHFDEISVATEELARARRAQVPGQPVYVAPNGLSNYWLNSNDHIDIAAPKTKRIGFFSDNRSMSIEFAEAARALSTYLQTTDNSDLYLVGPLTVPPGQLPESQIMRGAWVDFMDLPAALVKCRFKVTPHQSSAFNHAQPHTKFIEAAAFGVPTISSPTAELAKHDVPGLYIAQNNEQFLQGLKILSDDTYHQKCQKALYEYSRDCCLATQSADVLIRQWSAKHEEAENETLTRLSAAS